MLPIMNQMTPEMALQVLDRAAARAPLTREEHGQVMRAVDTLRRVISPPAQESSPDETSDSDDTSQEGGTDDA